MSASFINLSSGQTKTKIYKVWVQLADSDRKVMGRLMELKDTSIVVLNWKEEKIEDFGVSQIEKLKFRRKGSVGRGAAIGGAAGIVAGFIVGQAEGDDDPSDYFLDWSMTAEEKGVMYAPGFATAGALIGGIVGALKKKFIIDSSQVKYDLIKPELTKFLAVRTEPGESNP